MIAGGSIHLSRVADFLDVFRGDSRSSDDGPIIADVGTVMADMMDIYGCEVRRWEFTTESDTRPMIQL